MVGRNTGIVLESSKGILDSGSVTGAMVQLHNSLQETVKTVIGYIWLYMDMIPALWRLRLRLRIVIGSSETLFQERKKKGS